MKHILSIFLFCTMFAHAQTQPTGYENYKIINNNDKAITFFDDFEDNRNNWDLSMESKYSIHKIENEVYYLESKDDENYDTYGRFSTQQLPINDSLNFEIEALIKLVSSNNTAEYGLLWGRSLCCEHNFNVNTNGFFSIGEFKFGWEYLVSPTYSKFIYHRDGYNRLTVRKANGVMYFFINKKLVSTMFARQMFGNKFGFWVSNGDAIKVDYFRINYLPDTILPTTTAPAVLANIAGLPTPDFSSFAVNQLPNSINKINLNTTTNINSNLSTQTDSAPIATEPQILSNSINKINLNTITNTNSNLSTQTNSAPIAAEPQILPSTPYQVRNIPIQLEGRKVLSGKETIVSDNEIRLQIWDEGEEDGDIISIYYNDKWILQNHTLTKKTKEIPLILDNNSDNYLILYINNEGSRPTNTVALSIDDGIRKRRLMLAADQRSCQSVRLVPPK